MFIYILHRKVFLVMLQALPKVYQYYTNSLLMVTSILLFVCVYVCLNLWTLFRGKRMRQNLIFLCLCDHVCLSAFIYVCVCSCLSMSLNLPSVNWGRQILDQAMSVSVFMSDTSSGILERVTRLLCACLSTSACVPVCLYVCLSFRHIIRDEWRRPIFLFMDTREGYDAEGG